jgi:type IV pilus assembly protein PilW
MDQEMNENGSPAEYTASSTSVAGFAQSGVTMIELLVAMVIALLGTVVIFTVYQNAEGFKRTTIAAGDAQTSGAVALFSIEQYVRTSGSSITTTNETQLKGSTSTVQPNLLLGCNLIPNPNAFGVVTGPLGGVTPIAPVRIIDGSTLAGGNAATSDVLVIMAGNADIATNPTGAGAVPAGAISVGTASNLLGWRIAGVTPSTRPADIALFVQGNASGGGGGTVSGSPCSLRRIRTVSSATGSGAITLANAVPAGTSYSPTTNIHNVGPTPYFISIGLNARQELVETSFTGLLTGEAATGVQRVLADGIVNMQAQYGVDDTGDDVIDRWIEPSDPAWRNVTAVIAPGSLATSGTTAAINKIKAIRVAILARSLQYEAPDRTLSPPACTVTPLVPVWQFLLPQVPPTNPAFYPLGTDILPAVSATTAAPNGDWSCFRYRSFETVIPIINMMRSPL